MTLEILLLILRHGLTAVGSVLMSKGVLSQGAFDELLGAALAIAGLIWSARRKQKRRAPALAKPAPKPGTVLSSLMCLLLLLAPLGCVTAPDGSAQPDLPRIARLCGAAAELGSQAYLLQHPHDRPAFVAALEALRGLQQDANYDPAALAAALRALPVREFQGDSGALIVSAAVLLWDEAVTLATPITKRELVAAVLPKIIAGLARALESTQPQSQTPQK